MTLVHLHLILTHFPVVGLLFGLLLLGIALLRENHEWATAGLLLIVLSAVITIPLYVTGEAAEDAVEKLAGVSEAAIERHEEAAEVSFVGIEILGALSLLALAIHRLQQRTSPRLAGFILAVGAIVFAHVSWTANLGGKIRHTEIASAGSDGAEVLNDRNSGKEHVDDD
jgi:uncharacterized membrane protein